MPPPPQASPQLQMVDGNLGALCSRGGPETGLLLSQDLVERGLFDNKSRVVPRIHK